MSRSYYYDNSAYTFDGKPRPRWANGIDSLLRLTQKNLIGCERGPAKYCDECMFHGGGATACPDSDHGYSDTAPQKDFLQMSRPAYESSSRPLNEFELELKTHLSSAKDSMIHMQKKIESDIEKNLGSKEKLIEDLRNKVRNLEDNQEYLQEQLKKAGESHQSKSGELGRRLEDLNLKFLELATKRELKNSEDQISSVIDSKIASGNRENIMLLNDLKKQREDDKLDTNEEFNILKTRYRELEKRMEEKDSLSKRYAEEQIEEFSTKQNRNTRSINDQFSKLIEELKTDFKEHENTHHTEKKELDSRIEQLQEVLTQKSEDSRKVLEKKLSDNTLCLEKANIQITELQTDRQVLAKKVEELENNEKALFDKFSVMLENKLHEYEERHSQKDAERDKSIEELTQLQNTMAIAIEDLKEDHKQHKEEQEKINAEKDERILQLEKKIEEINKKMFTVQEMLGDEDKQAKFQEFEEKIKKIEEELNNRQEMFVQYDIQMKKYEDQYLVIESKYKEAINTLTTRCDNLESDNENHKEEFVKYKNTIEEYKQNLDMKIKQLNENWKEVFGQLNTRVEQLEKRVDTLSIEIQNRLRLIAEELQQQREALVECMEAKGVKKEFANVGINVIQEKQLTTTQVGTDNFVHEIEVQTEIPPKASPVIESKQQIVKEMPVTRVPRISSEHEREELQDNPTLNRLIKKGNHPATVIKNEPKNVPPPEEEAHTEFGMRMRKPLEIEETGFQTYSPETQNRDTGLKVPIIHRDLLGSSPHYLREDFYTLEKDRRKLVTTQGAKPEQTISSTHYRKADKFDVNLDNLGKIGEEEAPRATYHAVINYRDIDFDSYEPDAAAPVTEFRVKEDVSEKPIYEDDNEAAKILIRKEDSMSPSSLKKESPIIKKQENAYIKEVPEDVKLETFKEDPEVTPSPSNPEMDNLDSPQVENISKPAVVLSYEQDSWEEEEKLSQEKKIENEVFEINSWEKEKKLNPDDNAEEGLEDNFGFGLDPDAFMRDIEEQDAEIQREQLEVEQEGFPAEDVDEIEDQDKEIRQAQVSKTSKGNIPENKPSDKLKNIIKMNEKALEIIESDRKKKKKETEQKYAQKGYIAGPGEDHSREEDPSSVNKFYEEDF